MQELPEPLNFSTPINKRQLNMNSNIITQSNIEKKINSLETKIMSLENTIMKLIKKIEKPNSPKKTKKNKSKSKSINSKTLKKLFNKLEKGPYTNMKKY